jgi:hypothetical protein
MKAPNKKNKGAEHGADILEFDEQPFQISQADS